MAKWPQLVPPSVCRTGITVYLESGVNLDGTPKKVVLFEGTCNYSEKSRQILNEQRQLVQLQAQALIPGDIAPGQDISGKTLLRSVGSEITRSIYRASRARNPDGTVNYTQLELI